MPAIGRGEMCAMPIPAFRRSVQTYGALLTVSYIKNRWCASGATQLRVILSLYDNDGSCAASAGAIFAPLPNYIRRSSTVMRAQIPRSSPDMEKELSLSNMVGREARIDRYAEGPSFRLMDYIEEKGTCAGDPDMGTIRKVGTMR